MSTLKVNTLDSFSGSEITVDSTASLAISNTTAASSATTGALQVVGGISTQNNLYVGGNAVVTGTLTANGGTIQLGDGNTDDVAFGGEITSNFVPNASSSYNIGSLSKKWSNMYSDTFTGALTGTASSATALATGRTIELTGAVTGTSAAFDGTGNLSITTTATSDPTITLGGDLTGSATLTNLGSATLTATIAANSVALGTDTTGNYMDNVTAGTGVTVSHAQSEGSDATISIGQSVATSATPSFDGLTVSGNDFLTIPAGTNSQRGSPSTGSIRYSSTDTTFEGYNGTSWGSLGGVKDIDGDTYITAETSAGSDEDVLTLVAGGTTGLTVSGSTTTVAGNLVVSGTTTSINTETINLADNTIVLNSNESGTPSQDGGIEVERGTSTNKSLLWDETNDKWTVGSETFVAATVEAALTGNVTGDLTGNVTGNTSGSSGSCTGNAATATTAAAWTSGIDVSLVGAVTGSVTGVDGGSNISITTSSNHSHATSEITSFNTEVSNVVQQSVTPAHVVSSSGTEYSNADWGNLTFATGTDGFENEPVRPTTYQDLALPDTTNTVDWGSLT